MSKVFSPGVRVGWALAEQSVVQRLVLAKEAADLCGSNLQHARRRSAGSPTIGAGVATLLARRHVSRAAATPCSWRSRSTSRRCILDASRRRVLRLGDAPLVARHARDACRRGRAAGRLRPRDGVLPRWTRRGPDAPGVLLPDRGRHRARVCRRLGARSPTRAQLYRSLPDERAVAVLAGGRSPEREVSLRSGHRVMTALASWPMTPSPRPRRDPLLRGLPAARVPHATSRSTARRARTGRFSGCSSSSGSPTRERRLRLRGRVRQAPGEGRPARAGVPTPPWVTIEARALRDLAAGAALHIGDRAGRAAVRGQTLTERFGDGLSFVDREQDLPAP